jgi:hypothetical protein
VELKEISRLKAAKRKRRSQKRRRSKEQEELLLTKIWVQNISQNSKVSTMLALTVNTKTVQGTIIMKRKKFQTLAKLE